MLYSFVRYLICRLCVCNGNKKKRWRRKNISIGINLMGKWEMCECVSMSKVQLRATFYSNFGAHTHTSRHRNIVNDTLKHEHIASSSSFARWCVCMFSCQSEMEFCSIQSLCVFVITFSFFFPAFFFIAYSLVIKGIKVLACLMSAIKTIFKLYYNIDAPITSARMQIITIYNIHVNVKKTIRENRIMSISHESSTGVRTLVSVRKKIKVRQQYAKCMELWEKVHILLWIYLLNLKLTYINNVDMWHRLIVKETRGDKIVYAVFFQLHLNKVQRKRIAQHNLYNVTDSEHKRLKTLLVQLLYFFSAILSLHFSSQQFTSNRYTFIINIYSILSAVYDIFFSSNHGYGVLCWVCVRVYSWNEAGFAQ